MNFENNGKSMSQQNTTPLPDNQSLDAKLARCTQIISAMKRVVVAFSAGVDSTLLLALAAKTLGPENVLAALGVSPSLPGRELAEAHQLARQLNVELVEIPTGELDDPQYAANPADRCYFCKRDLFSRLIELAKSRGFSHVLSGANADDIGDFRPGLQAGRELAVANPLLESGLTKTDIRRLSQLMVLPTWDKPAMACLASRIPYGQPITSERLAKIEHAEQAIRDLGFRQVRVRDHDAVARIEVPQDDLNRLLDLRLQIVALLKPLGYTYVTMDLQGFRSGSANESLPKKHKSEHNPGNR
jgi:pyridinium-3,5-biscarboxylic acid mononucleotide sulfurtransferase